MANYFIKRNLLDRINGSSSKNPSLSTKSVDAYRKLYETLKKKTENYLLEKKRIKKKIEELTQQDMYDYLQYMELTKSINSSSLKGFRATLLFHIYEKASEEFAKGSSITEYNLLYENVRKITPKDNLAHSERTNSSSLKFFDNDFYKYCINCLKNKIRLTKTEILLKNFLEANIHLGLRPHEWSSARTATYLSKSSERERLNMLIVDNAKHSNGRANGAERELLLNDLSKDVLLSISTIINILDFETKKLFIKKREKKELITWELATKKTMASAQLNMTRALNKLCKNYIEIYPNKKNFVKNTTLYSTRHQAIANAKSANMDSIVLAATFGHISTTTSKKYYGRKNKGWGKIFVHPTKESINVVANHSKKKDTNYKPSINVNLIFNHFDV